MRIAVNRRIPLGAYQCSQGSVAADPASAAGVLVDQDASLDEQRRR